ncbi:hypothetical protein BWO91_16750 [Plantibacter flavus]|nr:hypothetical protein BWO91_16750 [Plantibacter flavus]
MRLQTVRSPLGPSVTPGGNSAEPPPPPPPVPPPEPPPVPGRSTLPPMSIDPLPTQAPSNWPSEPHEVANAALAGASVIATSRAVAVANAHLRFRMTLLRRLRRGREGRSPPAPRHRHLRRKPMCGSAGGLVSPSSCPQRQGHRLS